jgi:hypothetical protein
MLWALFCSLVIFWHNPLAHPTPYMSLPYKYFFLNFTSLISCTKNKKKVLIKTRLVPVVLSQVRVRFWEKIQAKYMEKEIHFE